MADQFSISRIEPEDLDEVLSWLEELNWIRSLHTLSCSYKAQPDQWLKLSDSKGAIIGCLQGCFLDDVHSWFTFFIVKNGYRGQGHGKKLWDACREVIGCRHFGLSAVPDAVMWYEQQGMASYMTLTQYDILVDTLQEVDSTTSTNLKSLKELEDSFIEKLLEYDSNVVRVTRGGYLRPWMASTETTTFLSISSNGKVQGYGCIKKSDTGTYYLSPLCASSGEIAQALLWNLLKSIPSKSCVRLYIPERNPLLRDIILKHNKLNSEKNLLWMWSGSPPAVAFDQVFGMLYPGYGPA